MATDQGKGCDCGEMMSKMMAQGECPEGCCSMPSECAEMMSQAKAQCCGAADAKDEPATDAQQDE